MRVAYLVQCHCRHFASPCTVKYVPDLVLAPSARDVDVELSLRDIGDLGRERGTHSARWPWRADATVGARTFQSSRISVRLLRSAVVVVVVVIVFVPTPLGPPTAPSARALSP